MEIDNPEMSFYQLPTEIWIEIFRYVDIPCLIDLSRVCKHWNRLIFTHFAGRIQLNLDTTKRKRPPRDIGTASERYYKHLYLHSKTLNSLVYLFGMIKQLAVHLDTLELVLVTLECKDLVQLLAVCTRVNRLGIGAFRFMCDDKRHTLRFAMLSAVRDLTFDVMFIDAKCHLHKILQKMPNVKELNTRLYQSLDLTIFTLYPELKILRVTVSGKTINEFLRLRWPALEELDLTLLDTGEYDWFMERTTQQALQRVLLSCKSLKVASFDYEHGQQFLTAILTSLPHVEELQLSATCLRRAEWYSLDGMERMKCLKTLSISGQVNVEEEEQVVQIPTVEKLSIHTLDKEHGDVLKRFPNLKSLSMNGGLVEPVADVIPLLEELTVFEFSCIESDMVEYVQEFINLKTLNIYCDYIDKKNLILLCDIMVLPEMKCLNVCTNNNDIPPDIASLVAASNTACKFILNDKLVTTVPSCRRSERKRKLTANV